MSDLWLKSVGRDRFILLILIVLEKRSLRTKTMIQQNLLRRASNKMDTSIGGTLWISITNYLYKTVIFIGRTPVKTDLLYFY